MAQQSLSHHALKQAFEDASEHFSEKNNLESKLTERRYQDIELIDEGGAKLIYKTLDKVTGRKLVRAYSKTKEQEDEFLREAALHAQLEHPNIIPFYDLGLEDERPYFCMKYIRGETLQSYLNEKQSSLADPQTRSELFEAFSKVCHAVSYAHSHQVLHLDLKPSNIQLGPHGEVLVGDWGLARVSHLSDDGGDDLIESTEIQSSGQFTRHGYLSGTPGFMAPEQCEKARSKTTQTDIFALGALLVYILIGRPPFSGTQAEIIEATKQGSWDFSLEAIPRGLQPVVTKALAVRPEQRYGDVEALREDVNAYLAGHLTSAEQYSTRRLLTTLYQRNKRFVRTLIASCSIIIATTAFFIHKLKDSEQTALQAREHAEDEKRHTQQALHQLKQAQRSKEQQQMKFAENYLKDGIRHDQTGYQGHHSYDTSRDEQVYQMVNRALLHDPNNLKAYAMKGRLAMLTGRFEEAAFAFKRAGGKYPIHEKVASGFHDSDLKNIQVYVKMLWQLAPSNDERLINDLVFKVIFSNLPPKQMIYFVEETLNIKNNGRTKRLKFSYDSSTQSLDLSNNKKLTIIYMLKNLPIRELNLARTSVTGDLRHLKKMPLTKVNLAYTGMTNLRLEHLRGKPIRELILTGCKVSDLAPIWDAPIELIDIRHTRISDFSQFRHYKELKTVICTEQQAEGLQKAGIQDSQITIK